jgi:hypothetical protein
MTPKERKIRIISSTFFVLFFLTLGVISLKPPSHALAYLCFIFAAQQGMMLAIAFIKK